MAPMAGNNRRGGARNGIEKLMLQIWRVKYRRPNEVCWRMRRQSCR